MVFYIFRLGESEWQPQRVVPQLEWQSLGAELQLVEQQLQLQLSARFPSQLSLFLPSLMGFILNFLSILPAFFQFHLIFQTG